jgi:hypothetical protein
MYGIANRELVFIPRTRAFELATLQRAVTESKTWGEFQRAIPPKVYAEIIEDIDRDINASDPFDPCEVGYCEGDWPGWPAQEMLDWVPQDIKKEFGKWESSVLNGPFLILQQEKVQEIVAAFEALGFSCKKDELLVQIACGDFPREEESP